MSTSNNKIIALIDTVYASLSPDIRDDTKNLYQDMVQYIRPIDIDSDSSGFALSIALFSALNNHLPPYEYNPHSCSIDNKHRLIFAEHVIRNLEFCLVDHIFKQKQIAAANLKKNEPAYIFYNNLNNGVDYSGTPESISEEVHDNQSTHIKIEIASDEALVTTDSVVPANTNTAQDTTSDSSAVESFVEDIALTKGLALISSDDWKKSKYARNIPVIVKNFNFKHAGHPELGTASFLVVGPKKESDLRIEIRTQTVSGSAGDKLPVLIHKLHSMQQSKQYGKTCAGIIGDINFFSKYSLDLARQVAANSGRVMYAEGDSSLSNTLSTVIDDIKELYSINKDINVGTPNLS